MIAYLMPYLASYRLPGEAKTSYTAVLAIRF
jgi:hypothetical protein